jgi:Uncharacterized protein involved in formation of curli polymers
MLVSACAVVPSQPPLGQAPQVTQTTPTLDKLRALPGPAQPIPVAVYEFRDQTGQNKPNENFSEYSRAVTQGGASILINALKEAGGASWFTVVDRQALSNLLQERQIVRATRDEYRRSDGTQIPMVGPLTRADVLLDGGIISYDSNIITGGIGARYLGIGGDVKYRQDSVTVYLRALSVSSGEVLQSVSVTKTIYSTALQAGAFKFVSFEKLLEAEAGFSTNEPVHIAVKQAIEKAVYSLIMEGTLGRLWGISGDPNQIRDLLVEYVKDRDGKFVPPSETEQKTAELSPQSQIR